jgi:hypothetical protein
MYCLRRLVVAGVTVDSYSLPTLLDNTKLETELKSHQMLSQLGRIPIDGQGPWSPEDSSPAADSYV